MSPDSAGVPVSPLPDIAKAGTEQETLEGFLDYYRAVLRRKVEGLTSTDLARTIAPSTMTLGGMLKHLTYVEYWWYRQILHDRPMPAPWDTVDWDADMDWDWHSAADDSPADLLEAFDAACAAARTQVAGLSLDHCSARAGRSGQRFSLRWIHVHMIEEYARHAGHADLLREAIDGAVGD